MTGNVANANLFYVNQEETETSMILYLSGQLDLSMATYFRSIIDPLATRPDKELTLNLRDLRYIDSTGLGILISVLRTRADLGAAFRVVEVSPKVKRLLDVTGISKFIALSTKDAQGC